MWRVFIIGGDLKGNLGGYGFIFLWMDLILLDNIFNVENMV